MKNTKRKITALFMAAAILFSLFPVTGLAASASLTLSAPAWCRAGEGFTVSIGIQGELDYATLIMTWDNDDVEYSGVGYNPEISSYAVTGGMADDKTFSLGFIETVKDSNVADCSFSVKEGAAGNCNFTIEIKNNDFGGKDVYSVYGASASVSFGAEAPTSGALGSLSWSIDNKGVLTIGGSGAVPSFKGNMYSAPWCPDYESAARIKKLVIEDGVTGVGASAFGFLDSLTDVVMADSVAELGKEAFSHCFNLKKIELSDSLTAIPDDAFNKCGSLESITLPKNVKSIGNHAFIYTQLKKISLPDGLTSIGDMAFVYAPLEEIVIPDSVVHVGEGAFATTALKSVVIGKSVSEIGEGAFNANTPLEKITVSAKNAHFKSDSAGALYTKDGKTLLAFPRYGGQIKYTVPDGVETISANAFCRRPGLFESEKEDVLAEINLPSSVSEIGAGAFSGCSALKKISLPKGITAIPNDCFAGCSALSEITVPNGVKTVGESAFSGCSGLKTVTIPAAVETIGNYAFARCTGLTGFSVDKKNAFFSSADGVLFNKDKTELILYPAGDPRAEYAIPEGVTTVRASAFAGAASLETVVVPVSLTSVGAAAFSGCDGLKKTDYAGTQEQWNGIEIGSDNDALKNAAYFVTESGKTGNLTWTLYSNGELVVGGTGKLDSYGLFSCEEFVDRAAELRKAVVFLTMENGVTEASLSGFNSMQTVTVPGSVVKLYDLPETLTSYSVSEDNPVYSSDDSGILYSKDRSTLIAYPAAKEGESFTVPTGVTKIGSDAFRSSGNLTEIILSDTVKTIGIRAFAYCEKLAGITIPDGVSLIGEAAFSGCKGLSGITIPGSVKKIGNEAFNECANLSGVTLRNGVTTLGNSAFSGCESLAEISLPDSVTKIGRSAFDGCNKLTEITIPTGVTTLGDYAFSGCESLAEISLPDGITSFGRDAFNGTQYYNDKENRQNGVLYIGNYLIDADAESLSGEYTIKKGTKLIADEAFRNCSGLTNVIIPDSVTIIGYSAFSDCSGLTAVNIPDGVTSVSGGLFSNCSNLKNVIIPDSVTDIGNSAFSDCTNLETVLIPDGVISIGTSAFYGCSDLASIKIPDSVISIGTSAFYGCTALSDVTIGNGVKHIYDSVFYETAYYDDKSNWENGVLYIDRYMISLDVSDGITQPENFIVKDGTIAIASDAFSSCDNIKSVVIPNSVTALDTGMWGYGLFCGCSGLETLSLPDSLEYVGSGTFAALDGLLKCAFFNDINNWKDGILYLDNYLIAVNTNDICTSLFWNDEDFKKISHTPYQVREGTRLIAECAFSGSDVESLVLPRSVKFINDYAFSYCKSLTEITLSPGMKAVEANVFSGCENLESVVIPKNITLISENAFESCMSLTDVYYTGSEAEWNAVEILSGNDALTGATVHYNYHLDSEEVTEAPTTEAPTTEAPTTEAPTTEAPTTEAPTTEAPTTEAPTTEAPTTEAPTTEPAESITSKDRSKASVDADAGQVTVLPGVTAAELDELLGGGITVLGADGKEIDPEKKIGTGAVVKAADGTEFTVVVPGDTDGDGKVGASDARKALRDAAKLEPLTGAFSKASDIDGDGKTKATDARKILRTAARLDVIVITEA